jgi:protein-S-isoprenylcysteine O-methyltransferase Ste14
MSEAALLILIHQLVFQGIFFAKNLTLRHKLGKPIRGNHREANLSIIFFVGFIGLALYLAFREEAPASFDLISNSMALSLSFLFMLASLVVGWASLKDLGDSWRVGVIEEQQTQLIETGIYRFTRNPYFVAYLLIFAAYTLLLQNLVLLVLAVIGCGMVHAMIRKEEEYLASVHGKDYQSYKERVPRYLLL